MLRRLLSIGTAFSITFVLWFAPYGAEYELQYKVWDSSQRSIYYSYMVIGTMPLGAPDEKLSAEPKYRSSMPIYAVAELGKEEDNKYTIVLDESRGTGSGYDILYADRNNNEDLTDDSRIEGRIANVEAFYRNVSFDPIEVLVGYGGKTFPYHFSLDYSSGGAPKRSGQRIENVSLAREARGYYSGFVSFGELKRRVAVFDYNANGVFGEYFKFDPGGATLDGTLCANGDWVLIDVNDDGRFERGSRGNRELYRYGKYVQLGGKWYSLDIAPHGGKVKVETPSLRFGTVRIPFQVSSGFIELVSPDGTLRSEATGQDFQVPTGTYRLYACTADVKDSSGVWQYDAQGTESEKEFNVAEGKTLPLRLGPPLLVNVHVPGSQRRQANAGDTIDLSMSLSGQGEEYYTCIERNGDSPPTPRYKIVDEAGKVLAKGNFEYG